MTTLVRPDPVESNDPERLRARVTELETRLDERVAEVERVKADLEVFRIRYRQDVGLLHEQLDELELAIAEAELGEITRRLDGVQDRASESPATPAPPTAARFTSDAVRKLFRDVAKAIHPDLAGDAVARARRHRLMVAANRAYAVGDAEQLRSILEAWENSPEAVPGDDPEAVRARLLRRAAEIEDQLSLLDGDLAELQDSPLWKLKAMVDEAAARGKDLVGDMVRRLKRDIMAATNRLDAMRPPPR